MSSCSCGHHHHHHPDVISGGTEISLAAPLIAVEGRLICRDPLQMMLALELLPDHVTQSRAEPGNLRFDLAQDDDPMHWTLNELFISPEAFAAHRSRTATTRWGQESTAIERNLHRQEIRPRIRPEARQDQDLISALLTQAFGGEDEARLVKNLRDQADLSHSLVADAQGTIIGHVALSPIRAERPAFALAPISVLPKAQGLGIGSALVRAALELVPDAIVVVLGDPAYYTRFGFRPVAWNSPYAGPYLMAFGPDLPTMLTITHAPAFDSVSTV